MEIKLNTYKVIIKILYLRKFPVVNFINTKLDYFC